MHSIPTSMTPRTQNPATAPVQWWHHAACRDQDPEMFFPTGPNAPLQTTAAQAVCRRCPVLLACQSEMLETWPTAGVWAGITEHDRDRLARNRVAVAA